MPTRAEIKFRGEWPEDVRATVESYLKPWAHLIPGWCRIFYVRFEDGDGDTSATVVTAVEGRWATMRIQSAWMNETPDDRVRAVIHEIAHLHVEPIRSVFVDLCNTVIDDEHLRKFAWKRFEEAWEGSVEDLAWAFWGMKTGGTHGNT